MSLTRERMPRVLRNAIAELIIAALTDDEAVAALAELGARQADDDERASPPFSGIWRPRPLTPPPLATMTVVRRELASAAPEVRDAVRERVARALTAVASYRGTWPLGGEASACAALVDETTTVALRKAAALFNAALYFEVHEVLEAAWSVARGATRVFVQGLLQVAVALHHAEHGNAAGARRLLDAGRAKLAPHAPQFADVDVAGLLDAMTAWERARASGLAQPAPPRLVVRS